MSVLGPNNGFRVAYPLAKPFTGWNGHCFVATAVPEVRLYGDSGNIETPGTEVDPAAVGRSMSPLASGLPHHSEERRIPLRNTGFRVPTSVIGALAPIAFRPSTSCGAAGGGISKAEFSLGLQSATVLGTDT